MKDPKTGLIIDILDSRARIREMACRVAGMPGPGWRFENTCRTKRWVKTSPMVGNTKRISHPWSPLAIQGNCLSHPTPFFSTTANMPATTPMKAARIMTMLEGPTPPDHILRSHCPPGSIFRSNENFRRMGRVPLLIRA